MQSWSLAQGLPEESIYAISETPDGYIWLATRDGLVRFDGLNFKVFFPGQRSITRDNGFGGIAFSKDALWVGARDYFAFAKPDRFDSFTNLAFSVAPFPRDPSDRFGIAFMNMRPNGELLFQRADGVYTVSPTEREPRPKLLYAPPPHETVQGFHEAPDGRVWMITQSGLKIREAQDWKPVAPLPVIPRNLLGARDGSLWIHGAEDLYRLSHGRTVHYKSKTAIQLEPLRGLLEDAAGAIWVASIGGVLRIANGRMERLDLKDFIQPDDGVQTLFQSKDGAIWAGTGRGALVRIQARTFELIDHNDGLGNSITSSVVQDDRGRLWIASRTSGVYTRVDHPSPGAPTWRKAFQTGGTLVFAIAAIPGGNLLVADSQGLWQSDGTSAQLLLPSPDQRQVRFSSFSAIRDSHLYYANPTTIYRLDLRPGAPPARHPGRLGATGPFHGRGPGRPLGNQLGPRLGSHRTGPNHRIPA